MQEQQLLEEVRSVVANKLCVAMDTLLPHTSFVGDLGADSLDLVDLMMDLEVRYGISISEQDAGGLLTLADAARFVGERIAASGVPHV